MNEPLNMLNNCQIKYKLDVLKNYLLEKYQFILGALIIIFYILIVSSLQHNVLGDPVFKDPLLKYKIIAEGLSDPTGLGFVDNGILIIEKEGKIRLWSDQQLAENPIHEFDVNANSERGLLGIEYNGRNIFVYLTEITNGDILKNRVYKFLWNGNELTNQKLLIDLPALPGPNHNGGKLVLEKNTIFSNNDNLYVIIGDLNHRGILQNLDSRDKPDNTGIILKINSEDGSALETNPFSSNANTAKYFAYGIRNSFGITIDPLSGTLWQTENGPSQYDEVNIVKPGFNSGWSQVMGPIAQSETTLNDLQMLPNSIYLDPQLSWRDPVALTDIEFINSTKLGDKYYNMLLIGDYNQGNIYIVPLDRNRENILLDKLNKNLLDKVVDDDEEADSLIFGTGFGGISDIEIGPDGYLYVLSFKEGKLYMIFK
jgi:glucose/arabinose dehydrogenase